MYSVRLQLKAWRIQRLQPDPLDAVSWFNKLAGHAWEQLSKIHISNYFILIFFLTPLADSIEWSAAYPL